MTTNGYYLECAITRPPSATSSLVEESLSVRAFVPLISVGKRLRRRQTDDFVTVQCFEEWLNTAAHEATHLTAVDLHLADSRRPSYLPDWWGADEGDRDASGLKLLVHTGEREGAPGSATSSGLLIRCVVGPVSSTPA